jgi:diguanylate cyclase (GGDEF)-like protein
VINETFGMHVGDDVIVSVAECMAKALPAAALSARISGDRLAALIPNANLEGATAIAEKVCAAAAAIAAARRAGYLTTSR